MSKMKISVLMAQGRRSKPPPVERVTRFDSIIAEQTEIINGELEVARNMKRFFDSQPERYNF